MDYSFDMGNFVNNMMYYATTIFSALIPIGAITAGLSFGVGLVALVVALIKGSIRQGF